VVLATGAYQRPLVPPLGGRLDPGIVALHSSAYRSPAQLPQGPVLVVGAGNSGAEIALELARSGREVWLAGRDTGALPTRLLGRTYWWLVHRVLTQDRALGRRVLRRFRSGGSPLIRTTPRVLRAAGVVRVGRIESVRDGRPVLADGTALDPSAVVWCTGFVPDRSWVDPPLRRALDHHERGAVVGEPGLYLLGTPFQYALTSSFLGGVGRDAAHVADLIAARSREPASSSPLWSGCR
jgi:putative flavoprotein involved in K+ transport